MVGVEKHGSLRFIKFLVHKKSVEIDLWENGRGGLFIRLPVEQNTGKLLVQVASESIIAFLNNELTIGNLCEAALSPFVTLQEDDQNRLLYMPDADIELQYADHYYKQLFHLQ